MDGRRVFAWPVRNAREILALICTVLVAVGDPALFVRTARAQDTAPEAAKLSNDQLDSLVAPLALYPDPLLAQTLAASTYPLEIIQLQQWMGKHPDLKDKALTDAVMKENWDPSIQAMAPFPDVVKQLAENVKWTSELGNAFLAQQSDVMDAVQRMRAKAKNSGNLKTTEQQKVETKTVESKQVIVIEPAKTEVIYVPSYNPTVVYGPPVVAYPPVYYPPPPPPGAYVASAAISFGVGMMVGAAMSGGWGYGCGWGNNNVNINVNNNYVKNYNRQNVNNQIGSGNNTWQHNSQHRGGAPYADRATANKYGGTTRGASANQRQASARQNQAGGAGARQNQAGGAGSRQQPGVSDRASGDGRTGGGGRDVAAKPSTRDAGGIDRGSGSSDRVGSRDLSGGSKGSGAFGSGGSSASSARSSSSRGASSMSSSRGGGGGGSRGGGGGGRRR